MRFRALAALFLFCSVSLLHAPEAKADRFSFSRQDNQMHVLSTFGLTLSATLIMESRRVPRWQAVLISSLAAVAFTVGKETLFDPYYSQADMTANAVGVLGQALFVFTFQL